MNLAIDLGNTLAKIGCFKNRQLLPGQHAVPFEKLEGIVAEKNPDRIIISSVNQKIQKLNFTLGKNVMVLGHKTPLPITINYKTPETLGKDRIAAVVGAYMGKPATNTLVIDIGTCITYDFINDKNEYLGGAISPGVEMKLKAMNTFTARLPLVHMVDDVNLIGNTTEEALQSGAINGTKAEIEEIIRMYSDKFRNLRFVICGGGAEYFGSRLKSTVEICPELVLIGLNGILEYNA